MKVHLSQTNELVEFVPLPCSSGDFVGHCISCKYSIQQNFDTIIDDQILITKKLKKSRN